jgi:hypothetical protein
MRLFKIRKASIREDERSTLEFYGVAVIQLIFALKYPALQDTSTSVVNGVHFTIEPYSMKLWLTERHDYQERQETWSFLMEVAITMFVILEVVLSIIGLFHQKT